MTRVLRSATKKIQNSENLSSKLSVSKKSKTIKKSDKKVIEIKNEDKKQSDIWNINSILSNIFSYTDHKDLVQFNAVCKKWNNLTNPIIHKTIKLVRKRNLRFAGNNIYDNTDKKYANSDVAKCISNNAKHAHQVKELKYNYKLSHRRALEVFETFRFISNLTICELDMTQDQFLGMISPLTQLQELDIYETSIKNNNKKGIYKEAVQLPLSLNILKLMHIDLTDNPELFVQTINSHRNLVKFGNYSEYDKDYLDPFYKYYPSLLTFEFVNNEQEAPQSLLTIFIKNPQLIRLRLECLSSEIVKYISNYLTNLEDLYLIGYGGNYTEINFKFPQTTKIKKLSLYKIRLNNCSLNSILLNCPDLNELELSDIIFMEYNSVKFWLSNAVKLKKLVIHCDALSTSVLNSILLNCRNISELDIILPNKWKEATKSICEKCAKLERLEIKLRYRMSEQERDAIYKEFYESEFITGNYKFKSTLTHLTLNHFKVQDSKAEYFKTFKSLKSIKYPRPYTMSNGSYQEIETDMDLWPGYRLITNNGYYSNVELKKNQ
jgi:hypothetical protein